MLPQSLQTPAVGSASKPSEILNIDASGPRRQDQKECLSRKLLLPKDKLLLGGVLWQVLHFQLRRMYVDIEMICM